MSYLNFGLIKKETFKTKSQTLLNMDKKKIKSNAKKIWHFIWEEDSLASWAVNIILAFVLIKFLVYPGLGLVLGTKYPIVAVVSGSMEHNTVPICSQYDSNGKCLKFDSDYGEICGKRQKSTYFMNFEEYWATCGDWYITNTNITKNEFESFMFKRGFNTGDIMLLYKPKPENIKVGDTIVFTTSSRPDPIIHRVIKTWKDESGKTYFQTKGDHNSGINYQVTEQKISEDRYLGKAFIRVPYLGWIKIAFVKGINFCVNGLVTFINWTQN